MQRIGLVIAGAALVTIGLAAQVGAPHGHESSHSMHPTAPVPQVHAQVQANGGNRPSSASPSPSPATPPAPAPPQNAEPASGGGDGGGDGGD